MGLSRFTLARATLLPALLLTAALSGCLTYSSSKKLPRASSQHGLSAQGRIIGYNAPPHSLTLERVNQLAELGLRSWRVVEPYDEGSHDPEHLRRLIDLVLGNGGECLVTLLNSNPGIESTVPNVIWQEFLAKEGGDVGKARRALFAGGIRTSHAQITDWILREAVQLHAYLPARASVEFWNLDIYHWGTNWVSDEPTEEWAKLFSQLGSLSPATDAFPRLARLLEPVFEGRTQLWSGGFIYAESDGLHRTGPQDQIVEVGVNVVRAPERFTDALKAIPPTAKRVYLQWLVNPQWGWWALPLEQQWILWDPVAASEFLRQRNREPDPYGLISVLGWQPVYDFVSSVEQ